MVFQKIQKLLIMVERGHCGKNFSIRGGYRELRVLAHSKFVGLTY